MLIQIRGSTGSGKSAAVREFMSRMRNHGEWKPISTPQRTIPLYYSHTALPITVIGSYKGAKAGCDSIQRFSDVFGLINKHLEVGVVIAEGLLLSTEVKRTSNIPNTRVLYLTTPPEVCVDRILKRKLRNVDRSNLLARVLKWDSEVNRARRNLSALGVVCYRCSDNQCVDMMCSLVEEYMASVKICKHQTQ